MHIASHKRMGKKETVDYFDDEVKDYSFEEDTNRRQDGATYEGSLALPSLNTMRFIVGTLTVVSCFLYILPGIWFLMAIEVNFAQVGILTGNILCAVAGFILLSSLRKRGALNWHFEAIIGVLLFISAILQLIASGHGLSISFTPQEVSNVAGSLLFITYSALIIAAAKSYGSLNLPRPEGLQYIIFNLVGGLLFTISQGWLLLAHTAYSCFIFHEYCFVSVLLQVVAMLILLYPYIRGVE